MTARWFLVVGAILAAAAVAAGAFGAHALSHRIPAERVVTWETAARYHMYHALALMLVGLAGARWPAPLLTAAGWLFVVGTLIFAGTVYALALGAPRWFGAVTPLGGIALIAGWLAFAAAIVRSDF